MVNAEQQRQMDNPLHICTCMQAMNLSLQIMERVGSLKRRTLDPIAERIYFYASWAHELNGSLSTIRSALLAAHRTACLHHNTTCQATLLNLLLRNYQVHCALLGRLRPRGFRSARFPSKCIRSLLSMAYVFGSITSSMTKRRSCSPRQRFLSKQAPHSSHATCTTLAVSKRCSLNTRRRTVAFCKPSAKRLPAKASASVSLFTSSARSCSFF